MTICKTQLDGLQWSYRTYCNIGLESTCCPLASKVEWQATKKVTHQGFADLKTYAIKTVDAKLLGNITYTLSRQRSSEFQLLNLRI